MRCFAAPSSPFSTGLGDWTNLAPEQPGRFADEARAARQQLDMAAGRLEALSPLAVLGRGYSLTQRTSDCRLIRAASELLLNEQITTRFASGRAVSRVEKIEPH